MVKRKTTDELDDKKPLDGEVEIGGVVTTLSQLGELASRLSLPTITGRLLSALLAATVKPDPDKHATPFDSVILGDNGWIAWGQFGTIVYGRGASDVLLPTVRPSVATEAFAAEQFTRLVDPLRVALKTVEIDRTTETIALEETVHDHLKSVGDILSNASPRDALVAVRTSTMAAVAKLAKAAGCDRVIWFAVAGEPSTIGWVASPGQETLFDDDVVLYGTCRGSSDASNDAYWNKVLRLMAEGEESDDER